MVTCQCQFSFYCCSNTDKDVLESWLHYVLNLTVIEVRWGCCCVVGVGTVLEVQYWYRGDKDLLVSLEGDWCESFSRQIYGLKMNKTLR